MKVLVSLSLTALIFLTPVVSEPNTYPKFFSAAGTFFTLGAANEYVYTGSTGSGLTSQLTWPIPLSLGAWTSFGARMGPHWELNFRFEGAQAITSADQTDQDWNIYDSDGDAISHMQSTSTAYLDSNWEFRAETAFPFALYDFEARPLLGLFYHQYYWEAWGDNATISYASGTTNSFSLSGSVGTYRQEWFVPYVGFEMKKDMHTWSWGGALRVSPYLFANNTDEHILRQLTFNDSLSGGFMVEPSLTNEWVVLPNVSLQADFSYRLILGVRGDETVSADGSTSSSSQPLFATFQGSGGADLQTFKASLGLKVAF